MRRVLDAVVVLLTTSLLLILALGGLDFEWGPLRIRLHDWARPLILLAVALSARGVVGALSARSAPGARGAVGALGALGVYVSTCGLLALLLASAAIYAHHHVRVAGGLDSYGYVSAASLIASGRLAEPQRLAPLLPFDTASMAAAPIGYIPGTRAYTSVPRFPLGLPAVMALFTIFGPTGPFVVPLVMAYLTIALAYLLGREPGLPVCGLLAAVLVAVDPLVVAYAIQPMSDVPATCWLLAALWLRLERPHWPIAAGACAGMAFLTRPALLPAAVVLVVVSADRSCDRWLKFGATVLAFIALLAVLNTTLYGGVSLSGYGTASHMFELSFSRLGANVSNFGKWLTYSHSALFWLVWPAALFTLRRSRWAWQVSAVAAAAAAPYLFYLIFDDWESSRFLLPAIVLVLILGARAGGVLLGARGALGPRGALGARGALSARGDPGAREGLGAVGFLLVAFVCATASHRFLEREGIYNLNTLEAKYALVGEWFRTHTSDRAVVLSGLHSGSIRLYGFRETIRWDQLPPDALGPTLRTLVSAGYEPYLALDLPSEPPLFAERFRSEPGVRTEPIARVRVVNIYRFVSAH